MKIGIIGLSGAGKTTVFEALTQNFLQSGSKNENRIGTVRVPDERVDVLSSMYEPKKTTFAQVEYLLPGIESGKKEKNDQNSWIAIRNCDALIHVARNFPQYGLEPPNPYKDFLTLDQEFILADTVTAEKRLEKIELEKKRGRKINLEELSLLQECIKNLENEIPLRKIPEIAASPFLKGFAFLTAKPITLLFNNQDEDETPPPIQDIPFQDDSMVMRAKLEHEIAGMSEEEAKDFLEEFNIQASALDRIIKHSYKILGLISFFTVGKDEVKAWTIKEQTHADDAAGAIHTDFKKGFIRAEVVSYNDLIKAGNYNEAKKQALVRLEGKTYIVSDGDIINFRFNV